MAFRTGSPRQARLLPEQRWSRLSPGVFCTGSGMTWPAAAWAAVLVGGDRARLGGRAAGFLAGRVDEPPDDTVVRVAAAGSTPVRQTLLPCRWTVRRDRQGLRGSSVLGHPPRIRTGDVVLDLIAEATETEAIDLMTAAVGRRLVSPAQLARALDRRCAVPNRKPLAAVLNDVTAGAHSPLELRHLRDVERAHGLPAGIRQVRRR